MVSIGEAVYIGGVCHVPKVWTLTDGIYDTKKVNLRVTHCKYVHQLGLRWKRHTKDLSTAENSPVWSQIDVYVNESDFHQRQRQALAKDGE